MPKTRPSANQLPELEKIQKITRFSQRPAENRAAEQGDGEIRLGKAEESERSPGKPANPRQEVADRPARTRDEPHQNWKEVHFWMKIVLNQH